MKSVRSEAVRDVLLLSLAAGSADAAGFFGLGRVFTSNMTGNVVLLGVALGQGRADDAARSIFVLTVFILGLALGVRLGSSVAPSDWARLSARLIGLEKIALLLFALGWIFLPRTNEAGVYMLLLLLAAAMGLQTAALAKLGAPGVATTAITGTITALVTGLVSLAVPDSSETSGSRLRFQAGVLALYCLGAGINGCLLIKLPWLAGCVPIAAALFVSQPVSIGNGQQKD